MLIRATVLLMNCLIFHMDTFQDWSAAPQKVLGIECGFYSPMVISSVLELFPSYSALCAVETCSALYPVGGAALRRATEA